MYCEEPRGGSGKLYGSEVLRGGGGCGVRRQGIKYEIPREIGTKGREIEFGNLGHYG